MARASPGADNALTGNSVPWHANARMAYNAMPRGANAQSYSVPWHACTPLVWDADHAISGYANA